MSEHNVEKVNQVMRKISSKKNIRHYSKKNVKLAYKDDYNSNSPGSSGLEGLDNTKELNTNLRDFVRKHSKSITSKSNRLGSSKNSINFIICDDDVNITLATAKLIRAVGNAKNLDCRISIFHNGIECMYNIYQESLKNKFLDFVIIDETMPFIRGSQVTKILKNMTAEKQLNDLAIYVATSYDDEHIISEIKQSGCDGVLKKPLNKDIILKLLEKHKFIK